MEAGKSSLRRLQWKSALGGNVVMQIWLGKQYLGQRDEHAVEVSRPAEGDRSLLELARYEGGAELLTELARWQCRALELQAAGEAQTEPVIEAQGRDLPALPEPEGPARGPSGR
jgi:hypothetical protein